MAQSREKNPNWKGGRTFTSNGYKKVLLPGSHLSDSHGYAFEHRMVAEQMLGRHLLPEEVVHHNNGNKKDNRMENLTVFPNTQHHSHFHTAGVKRKPAITNETTECACGCGAKFMKYDSHRRPRAYRPGHSPNGRKKKRISANCKCGCGEVLETPDKYGRSRQFVSGHNPRGKQGRHVEQD